MHILKYIQRIYRVDSQLHTEPISVLLETQVSLTDWITMGDEMLGLLLQDLGPFRLRMRRLALDNFSLTQAPHFRLLMLVVDPEVGASLFRVTPIRVGKLTINVSDNGLSPGRRQAIIWTNAGILLIGPLRTNFSEILIGIQKFSFKEMRLKMSSAKWCPFCLGLNELNALMDNNPAVGTLQVYNYSLWRFFIVYRFLFSAVTSVVYFF